MKNRTSRVAALQASVPVLAKKHFGDRLANPTPAKRKVADFVSRGLPSRQVALVPAKSVLTVQREMVVVLVSTDLPDRGGLIASVTRFGSPTEAAGSGKKSSGGLRS